MKHQQRLKLKKKINKNNGYMYGVRGQMTNPKIGVLKASE